MLALAASTSAALSNAELYQRVALEKERSFAILANIADGIVAVDREGQVVLWNEAAEKITGVPAEDALGRCARRGAPAHARVGQRHAARRPARLDHARPRGGVALGDRGGDARSGRRRRRPHLRVPRHLVRPARRADEVGLRLDGLARAAHAADLDLRLRGDAAAPGRALRRGGARDVPRLHRVGVAAPDGDRRRAAQRRAARHRRPAGQHRADRRARRRRRGRAERAGRRRNGHRFVVDLPEEPLAGERRPRQAPPGVLDPARQRAQVLARGRHGDGRRRAQARHGRGQRRRRGDRHPAGRPGADLPQVLSRRRRRDARRRGRHRARALHRARAS